MNYITITKDLELDIDDLIDEIGNTELLERIGDDDIANYLSNQYEDEALIEMLDIRIDDNITVSNLDDNERRNLLWVLLKDITWK